MGAHLHHSSITQRKPLYQRAKKVVPHKARINYLTSTNHRNFETKNSATLLVSHKLVTDKDVSIK